MIQKYRKALSRYYVFILDEYKILFNSMLNKQNINWKLLVKNIDSFITDNENPEINKKLCLNIKSILYNNYFKFGLI